MSLTVRRLIACLLIAFVPLQATAASRLALCVEMGNEVRERFEFRALRADGLDDKQLDDN